MNGSSPSRAQAIRTVANGLLAVAAVLALGAGAQAQQAPPPGVGMPQYVGIPSEQMNHFYTNQRSSQWCWAACIQMVLSRFGVSVPQEDIVRRTYGTDPAGRLPDMPANIEVITKNLNNWGVDSAGKRYQVRAAVGFGPPPNQTLLSELAAGCPIILGCNTGQIGHAVVCTGVGYVLRQSDASGQSQPVPVIQSLVIRDPWPREGTPVPGRIECRADELTRFVAFYWCVRAQGQGQVQPAMPNSGPGPEAIYIRPQGTDEREPNDDPRQADVIHGLTISGTMATPADQDWFALGGQEGTRATFTISHAPNVDFDFEVYSDGKPVARAVGTQPGDGFTCDVPGRVLIRVWSAQGAGPYAIVIHPGGGSEREPNDEPRLADPVRGLTISGAISAPNDVDWFALLGQEGTRATFTINHAPNVDFDFDVYSDNQCVGRALGVQPGDSVTCNVPGRVFVRVWSARGTGPYAIGIRPLQP